MINRISHTNPMQFPGSRAGFRAFITPGIKVGAGLQDRQPN